MPVPSQKINSRGIGLKMAKKILYHGVKGDKLEKMLPNDNTSKEIKFFPDGNNEIYFDTTSFQNCFVHGADTTRKKSFVVTAEVELDGLQYRTESRPGNPTTLIVTSTTEISGKVIELRVRSGNRDDGFEIDIVREISLMKVELKT